MNPEEVPKASNGNRKRGMMTYALDQNNKLVHVDSVPNGLKCNCHCPACGEQLSARQGKKNGHSFAHSSESKCAYGYQTSLHLLAKEIISEGCDIILPPVMYDRKELDFSKLDSEDRRTIEIPIREPYSFRADSVELEKQFDCFIPDIILYYRGKPLIVEIYVTHSVDEEKEEKIRKAGVSAIEFDLSAIDREIDKDCVRSIFETGENCHWVFNKVGSEKTKEFMETVEKKYQERKQEEQERRKREEKIRQESVEKYGGYFQYYDIKNIMLLDGKKYPFLLEPPCVKPSRNILESSKHLDSCFACPFFVKTESEVQGVERNEYLIRLLCQRQKINTPNSRRNLTTEKDMGRWIEEFYLHQTDKVSRYKSKNEELVQNLIYHAEEVARLSGHEEFCGSFISSFCNNLISEEYEDLKRRISMKPRKFRF